MKPGRMSKAEHWSQWNTTIIIRVTQHDSTNHKYNTAIQTPDRIEGSDFCEYLLFLIIPNMAALHQCLDSQLTKAIIICIIIYMPDDFYPL
jgi:hypothetical protein